MATVVNQQDQNQQQQNQVIQPGAAASTPAFAGNTPSNKPASSGAFTNIQSYLGANKGAGNQIAGQVLQQKDTFENQLGKGQQQAQDATQKASSEADSFKQGAQAANQILDKNNTLGNFVQNDAPTGEFAKWKSGQTGAQDYQNQGTQGLSTFQQGQQGLQQFGQNIGSEQGRQGLIQNLYGNKGNYGQGASALDQVFLQIGGANKLSQAQKDIASGAAARGNTYNDLLNKYNTSLTDLGTQAGATSQAIGGALTKAQQDFNTDLTNKASNLQTSRNEVESDVKQYLSSGFDPSWSPARKEQVTNALTQGGVNTGQITYGLNLSDKLNDYAKFAPTTVGAGDVINQQELARQKALATLSGGQAQYSQVGSQDPNQLPVEFMRDKLQADIATAKQQAMGTDLTSSWSQSQANPFNKSNLTYSDLLKLQNLVPSVREAGNATAAWNDPKIQAQMNATGLFYPYSGGSTDPYTSALYQLANTTRYSDPIDNFLKNQNVIGGGHTNLSGVQNPNLGQGK